MRLDLWLSSRGAVTLQSKHLRFRSSNLEENYLLSLMASSMLGEHPLVPVYIVASIRSVINIIEESEGLGGVWGIYVEVGVRMVHVLAC